MILVVYHSIRFPRLVRERDDKTPEQATTADQILDMYNSQDCIKNNAAFNAELAQDDDDDDFI
jgi:DNA ligase 1